MDKFKSMHSLRMHRVSAEIVNVMWVIWVLFMLTVAAAAGITSGYPFEQHWFKYYTKSDWGAQPATDVYPLKTPVPYVAIHHTYIPGACYTPDQCVASMRSMQTYHQSLGWGDIGYNFAVGGEGGVYEGRGWDVLGIHTGPANNYSIGIVLIGDFRTELPPLQQLRSTKALIQEGVTAGFISPDYKLIGHKQVMATECPGGALYSLIQGWEHYAPEFVVPTKMTRISTTNSKTQVPSNY